MAKRERKHKSGIGKLFLGIFLGFILSLGSLFGVGFFAYKKLSIVWLNKTFNTNFDLGTDEANNRTIEGFAQSLSNILQMNTKAYTFDQLKNDFGIDVLNMLSNSIGIDMSTMANTPITKISEGMKDVISNLNAEDLGKFIDVSALNNVILNKEITYYVDVQNNELYKNRVYSTKIAKKTLDYKIANNKVYLNGDTENGTEINKDTSVELNGTTYYVYNEELYVNLNLTNKVDKKKDFDYSIGTTNITVEGTVNVYPVDFQSKTVVIQVKNMNLVSAMNEYLNKIGDVTTIEELEKEFGVKLPDFMAEHIDKTKYINELGAEIDKIKLGYFLKGYEFDETDPLNIVIKNDKGEIVTGILYDLAIERVGNVASLTDKFNQVAAKDLDSVVTFSTDTKELLEKKIKYFVDVENKKLYKDEAKTKLVEFEYSFNEDRSKVIIEEDEFEIIDNEITLPLKVIPLTSAIADYMFAMQNQKTFGELAEEFNFSIPEKLEELKNKKLSEINDNVFNDIELGGFLGYIKDETDSDNTFYFKDNNENSTYEYDYDEKATGLMKVLTETTIGGLEDLSSIINNATAYDLESVMKFDEGTEKIFNKTNTFYYNIEDERLYRTYDKDNSLYSDLVDRDKNSEYFEFEYELTEDKQSFIINEQIIPITNLNEVVVPIKYLPLSYGLGFFTENMGEQLTFKELSEDFGVDLPSYLINRAETINNLSDVVNSLKLGEVIGYVEYEGVFYKDKDNSGDYTTGDETLSALDAKFANKTISELKNLKSIVDNLFISDIYSTTSSGVLALVSPNTAVKDIPEAIQTAINTSTLQTLVDKGVVATDVDLDQTLTVSGYTTKTIGELKFEDIFKILDGISQK